MFLLTVASLLFVVSLKFFVVVYSRSGKKKLNQHVTRIKELRKLHRSALAQKREYDERLQVLQVRCKGLELLLQDLKMRLSSR
jgi:hypothetical protein